VETGRIMPAHQTLPQDVVRLVLSSPHTAAQS
jgi:hypothetical protein